MTSPVCRRGRSSHNIEREFFRKGLETLPTLMANANVLIAWDADALDRGWCLLEGVVAEEVGNAGLTIRQQTHSEVSRPGRTQFTGSGSRLRNSD